MIKGKPQYMAPEHIDAYRLGRADLVRWMIGRDEAAAGVRERIAVVQKQLEGGGFSTTAGGAATGRGVGLRQRQQLEAELAASKKAEEERGARELEHAPENDGAPSGFSAALEGP